MLLEAKGLRLLKVTIVQRCQQRLLQTALASARRVHLAVEQSFSPVRLSARNFWFSYSGV